MTSAEQRAYQRQAILLDMEGRKKLPQPVQLELFNFVERDYLTKKSLKDEKSRSKAALREEKKFNREKRDPEAEE